MAENNVLKNPDKDINDALTTTCVGVDLVDGHLWSPPGARLWCLLDAVISLATSRRSSPGAVAAYIGVTQWYDLIRRLRLSVFRSVYDFSSGSKARDWNVVGVDDNIIAELLIDAVFLLFGNPSCNFS